MRVLVGVKSAVVEVPIGTLRVLPQSSVGGCRVTRSCARVWGPISRDAVLSAMRAGLTTRCLTFRDTFVCTPTSLIRMAFA